MNPAHTESFKQLRFYSFEWAASLEQALEHIRRIFMHASGHDANVADLMEVCTLENPLPEIDKPYGLSLTEHAGSKTIPTSHWFEYCAIRRMAGDALNSPLIPIQGGMLAIATACTMKGFLPYNRNIIAFFKNKNDDGEHTAIRFTLFSRDGCDRFNLTYEVCSFISSRDLIVSLWKV